MSTILVVDDELSMREFLVILLEKDGHRTLDAADGATALEIVKTTPIDLIISDIRMPQMSGLTLLEEAKKINQSVTFIMITAYASPEDAVTAMKNGAFDYITKPFKVDEIKRVIQAALSATSSQHIGETGTSSAAFQGIIGTSAEMRKIFDIVGRIAPTHANVLIYGESGTGKELVARAIHRCSAVADKLFITVNCSAIPESLFESELFGHVKGAFTGAIASKAGLFESANNGSIFLDEIGELTPFAQTKLLRVIQEREFKPVGGTETIKVNVRIISATNKNLEQEVLSGAFREDLFYRLAVVPIRVPPLRERKEDIPLLVDHFLNKYSERFGKNIQAISSYALEVLMDYEFPGNVRELENIIERGVAMEGSNIILPESLTLSMHRKPRPAEEEHSLPSREAAPYESSELFTHGLEEVMARLEKQFIERALLEANHSKMRAADLLKISFRSLRYKIQKYDIAD